MINSNSDLVIDRKFVLNVINGNNNDNLDSINDLVAVHVTPIPPVNDTIITQENSGVTNDMVFVDPNTGIQHKVPYVIGNDTIHFTLNCVVQNHEVGNDWNSYKYGVLIDFRKLDKSIVLDVKGEDTYVDGDAKLNGGYYLFCPIGERDKVKKENPGAIVIEYDGISLSDAISSMIVHLGYKLEPYGTYGWGRNNEYGRESADTYKLEEIVSLEGYPVLKGQFGNALHSETKYMARRMWKREYEALISLIKYRDENNIAMPNDILYLIMVYGGAYSLPGSVPVTIEDYKEVVLPIFKKYGYSIDEFIFNGLNEDGNLKIIYFPPSGNGFPVVNCPEWENTLRERMISMLSQSKKTL